MAFASGTHWDIRVSGSDSNGGGFNTSATGTDRSQQDTAFLTFTDIVIGGTNTTITSAAHPFDATSPGNVINITGGTGFTVQRIQIVSVAGGVATCDKAVGTAGSTGGTGNLGGALQTITKAFSLTSGTSDNRWVFWIKAGTYTNTAAYAIDCNCGCAVIGYNTAHGDITPTSGLTRPLLTTATNGVHLIDLNGSAVDSVLQMSNLSMSHTAGTRSFGINSIGARVHLTLRNCIMDGFSTALQGNFAVDWNWNTLILIATEIKNCTGVGIFCSGSGTGNRLVLYGSYIHNNGSHGVSWNSAVGTPTPLSSIVVHHSIIASNAGSGILLNNGYSMWAYNSTFANNSAGSGIAVGNFWDIALSGELAVVLVSNIFYGNSAYGVDLPSTNVSSTFPNFSNAYGSNGTAPRHNYSAGLEDVALTANPFTNSGAGDYSLNAAGGGGAACKGAGYPGVFPGAASTGVQDIGAVQASGAGRAQPQSFVVA